MMARCLLTEVGHIWRLTLPSKCVFGSLQRDGYHLILAECINRDFVLQRQCVADPALLMISVSPAFPQHSRSQETVTQQ